MKVLPYVAWVIASFFLVGDLAVARAQDYSCEPRPPSPKYKTLRIDASALAVTDGTLQYANNDWVWIVVDNVNPFRTTYVLTIKSTPVTEPPIGSFLTDLGGIVTDFVPKQTSAPQAASPPAAAAPPPRGEEGKAPPPACSINIQTSVIDKFNSLLAYEIKLNDAITDAVHKYNDYSTSFATALSTAQKQTECARIQTAGNDLRQFLAQVKSPDQLEVAAMGGVPNDQNPTQVLQSGISAITTEAKELRRAILNYRRAVIGDKNCVAQYDANA